MEWQKVTPELPTMEDMEVMGFNENWIDEDFNPKGIRVCFRSGNPDTWLMTVWNNEQDCWETGCTNKDYALGTDIYVVHGPTHFCYYPEPPTAAPKYRLGARTPDTKEPLTGTMQ